jgi:thioredoxin reductase (NADPH)
MTDELLDLAVIGAGPCGLAVGAAAREAGMRCVLFDRGPLTATIVREYPPYVSFFSTADKLEIGGLPFPIERGKPTREEALVYYRRAAEFFDLDVRQFEEVLAVEGTEGDFRLLSRRAAGEERSTRTRAVVVATGSFDAPNPLGVPGEELPKVKHRYDEPHPYWRQDVVTVGGGNSAVESALELWRAGARVTFVHFAHELDRGVKPWVLPDIRNRFEKGQISVRWGTRVERITPATVVLRDVETGAIDVIANDWVLAMTGWHAEPRILRDLGVPVDADSGVPEHDPDTLETPVAGVYIAGVLTAGNDANRIFIENGRHHGRCIVDSLQDTGIRLAGS